MKEKNATEDRSTWAIGGGLLIGLGIGLFYLPRSALAFVGCLLAGLGAGLILTSVISSARKSE